MYNETKKPLDNKREFLIPINNKRIIKVAEKKDYWRRFTYGSRIFVKTFQSTCEVKKLYNYEYAKLVMKNE